MNISPQDRTELSTKLAKGVEFEMKDFDFADQRCIAAFLAGWFESFLRRES